MASKAAVVLLLHFSQYLLWGEEKKRRVEVTLETGDQDWPFAVADAAVKLVIARSVKCMVTVEMVVPKREVEIQMYQQPEHQVSL
jgi:hypothetical protein